MYVYVCMYSVACVVTVYKVYCESHNDVTIAQDLRGWGPEIMICTSFPCDCGCPFVGSMS